MTLPGAMLLALLTVAAATAATAAPAGGLSGKASLEGTDGGGRTLGAKLRESLGRWYMLEVWSNLIPIDFGEDCIFFEIETDPDNDERICLIKTDIFKNGTRQRDPMCLVYDQETDNWVKPAGERRLTVLAAPSGFLVLDAPITLDHWVLVMGRRRRRGQADAPDADFALDASDASDAEGNDAQAARDPARQLARHLGLGSPSSSVRLPNPYPDNCDYFQE